METTKEKKVRPSKKALIRGVAENSNNYDIGSLERTNVHNLKQLNKDLIQLREFLKA